MQGAFSFIRSTGILVLSVLMLSACASKKDSPEMKQAGLYFGAGTQSLMDQQYTDALKSLLQADKLSPNNSEILNNLGMAYFFKGETNMAIETLKRSLAADKNNSDAKVNLASIYYKENKIDEAEEIYKKVLKDLTYDKQARTLYNLGILELNHRKDAVAAESYFKKSIKEDDNYCPSYYQLGLLHLKRRQNEIALKNFKEAGMGTCYDSPAPHYYQAVTLVELRRFDEARLKLDEIDTRFSKTVFAVKAKSKLLEIDELENKNKSQESHASRKVLESPDF